MPSESRKFDDVEVVAMPVKSKDVNYRGHEGDEERERLGFVIISEGKKVYFMGDSVYMPQLSKMKPDVLLIAVGGTFTQTPEEAAKDADVIEPNYAIPMCWGGPEGTRDNAEVFKDLAKVPVKVLSAGESLDF
jgi:L-ascorbate metabolism protein UlaG (beta-lactamase superfamily)